MFLLCFREEELGDAPLFDVADVCKVNGGIDAHDHDPVVGVCLWVLLDVSIQGSSRKTSQDGFKK